MLVDCDHDIFVHAHVHSQTFFGEWNALASRQTGKEQSRQRQKGEKEREEQEKESMSTMKESVECVLGVRNNEENKVENNSTTLQFGTLTLSTLWAIVFFFSINLCQMFSFVSDIFANKINECSIHLYTIAAAVPLSILSPFIEFILPRIQSENEHTM